MHYAAAGSRIINANTFGASAHKLAGSAYTLEEVIAAGIALQAGLCAYGALSRWTSARWANCWSPTAHWPLRMLWLSLPASSGPVRPPGLTSIFLRPSPTCTS